MNDSNEDTIAGNYSVEYVHWEQEDNLLLTWLLASLSEPIRVHMVGCIFSYQA